MVPLKLLVIILVAAAALVVLLVLIGLAALLISLRRRPAEPRYVARESLVSPAERSFLGALEQALDGEYRVFAKVRLADVADVVKTRDRSVYRSALNRIQSKHLDFLLCRSDDLAFVCAIELDDRSHSQRQREARDAFVAELCASIGLPLLRMPVRSEYSVPRLRQLINKRLAAAEAAGAETSSEPWLEEPEDAESAESRQPLRVRRMRRGATAPACPKCGAHMVRREVRTGVHAGRSFFGCSRFPTCRGVLTEMRGGQSVDSAAR